ncbi:hypothetical protein JG688_00016741 [Phytophthora aleatoria]|uniref:Deoxyribose-phosphate aldolase n=1 Tax=Phytophthora aleatoria TaxID=2496075 RepID=A0A8J5I3X8_9STRA|nr:hypothetical protein JG688_00016741 [Phytophthora aleatoria]
MGEFTLTIPWTDRFEQGLQGIVEVQASDLPEDATIDILTKVLNSKFRAASKKKGSARIIDSILLYDYFCFSSFKNLTVATGAAIFNSSPLFVYCFSICLLREKASVKKLFEYSVSFPLSAATTAPKSFEAQQCLDAGAAEIDMVINVGMLQAGEYDFVLGDIRAVVAGGNDDDDSCSDERDVLKVGFPTIEEGIFMLIAAIVFFVINFVCLSPAICWTSSLGTSVGFMLTIPLSGMMDTLIHYASFSWEFVLGSAGFAILERNSTKRSAQCS